MAALIVTAVVVLPLVFDPRMDDAYAFPKVSLLRVIGLVGAALFLGYVASAGSLTRNTDPWIDLPLACFAGLLIAASVASVDPVQSFVGEPYQYQGLVTGLLYIGSFYVARLSLGSDQGLRRILTAMAWTGAVVSVYGIAQGLGFDPFWAGPPDKGRVISSVGQANDLAAYLDLVVIAAAGLWPASGRRSRFGLGAVMVVALAALALTFSRGGYFGLVVGLGVLLVPDVHVRPTRRMAAAGLTLAAGVLLVAIVLPPTRAIFERIAHRAAATADTGESSIRFHLDLWRIGSQVALDHPLLGTGPETFPLVFRPYLNRLLPTDLAELLGRFRLESPHNELIGIAAEMGLPALATYVVFLGACAMACVRRARATSGAARSVALIVLAILATHVATNSLKTPDVTTSELFLDHDGRRPWGDDRTAVPTWRTARGRCGPPRHEAMRGALRSRTAARCRSSQHDAAEARVPACLVPTGTVGTRSAPRASDQPRLHRGRQGS
jgi:O-antigen ligase